MFQSGSEGRAAQRCAVLTRLLSPLIFNIAMTALDEHLMAPWKPGGDMATGNRRTARRRGGLPTWRLVRYADDFVVLVHGQRGDAEALHEVTARVLEPLGLRLSPAKTRIVHMSEAFGFLGFRIHGAASKARASGTSAPSSRPGASGP
jgi:RNA-directed DNA polymerase